MTISDIKISAATAIATLGVNVAWLIDLIPDNIGKLCSLVGLIAMVYVIKHHRQKVHQNDQQIEINKLEIAERVIRINKLRDGE